MTATRSPGTLMLLSRLSKSALRRMPEPLLGMSVRHYVALSYIANPGGISQQQLAEILMMDANNVVLLLNELEADGLITRERDSADRRRHLVQVTNAGQAGYERALTAREVVEVEILHNLSGAERKALHDLLVKALGADGH
ncbi:MAG: MarR family winged helix-turn-helix transcriptional regulator [Solirubrobacteraceae bacterium]